MSAEDGAQPVVDLADVAGDPALARLVELDAGPGDHAVGGLWGSSQALAVALAIARRPGPRLVIVSSEAEAEVFADDLAAFGCAPRLFPSRESYSSGRRSVHADAESIRLRLQVAGRVSGACSGRPELLVAPLLALLQPLPAPGRLASEMLHLQRGNNLALEPLLERLVGAGYERQPLAERPGEVSLRGDILDLFPFASELPLRVELFGEAIESLRSFDPADQRSVETLDRISVCLARDAGGVQDGDGVAPVSLLGDDLSVVEIEPLRIEDQAHGLRVQSTAHAHALAELERALATRRRLRLQSLPGSALTCSTRSVQALAVGIPRAGEALAEATAGGERAVVLCRTEAERHRFGEVLERSHREPGAPAWPGTVEVRVGAVAKGFRLPDAKLVLVNHREIAGIEGVRSRAPAKPAHRVRALQSFFELKLGDLVVHAVHGLARYAGLVRLERGGGEEDHLHLLFADDVSLYVPATRVDLVQRYIGSGGSGSTGPKLDKIGSSAFRHRKEKVERAVADLAAELLEVQARRQLAKRPAWPPDDDLMRDMVGSFPYEDTPDQAVVDGELRGDLTGGRPMDRLLCGDVGFGKTELAVRAAFRVVNGGGQVAVLVPTTVLAQQHYETFRERLADFPVAVATVSRYVTGAELREAVEGVADGRVDVLVGTHRLLSKDVRFKRLGLLIIDEEQRFGVEHKEHFKKLRATVDVLTLTATPIPRTLHMSLTGLRDISALTTPPEGRQEIETVLTFSEDTAVVREAILREKNRGGQVFFLHNRVQSIGRVARELQQLVPECSFLVGHGQMGGRQLAEVMAAFTRGEADVLVATTIIENGLDIPSAGTIVIDEADQFGLSDLHQLRGRVGRGRHKSYCYLLVDRTRPLRQVARERLKALEELSRLGAGFQISMKDLEIRGAGNILGPQQSGHIAAVGYDMYCRLIKTTAERLRGSGAARDVAAGVELELGIDAYLPEVWISSAETRLEMLRHLDEIRDEAGRADAETMLRDRFGAPPAPALALLRQFALKARLERAGLARVSWRGDTYLIEYGDRSALEELLGAAAARGAPRPELRPVRSGLAHLVVPADRRDPAAALDWLEELLHVGSPDSTMAAAPS